MEPREQPESGPQDLFSDLALERELRLARARRKDGHPGLERELAAIQAEERAKAAPPASPPNDPLVPNSRKGTVMPQAYKMAELAPEGQTAVERLIGRALHNDEMVGIAARTVPELSEAEMARRKQSAARILELARGKTIGGLSARELIEERRR